MLSMLFETGHPWITFKDACNVRSPQSHVGAVHSSNLCTEITLNTSETEIAVCNLGSVNLLAHMKKVGKGDDAVYELDHDKLRATIRTAMRMLDNVIDINYYAVAKARNSNLKHRPVGLGIMGFQDCLHLLQTPYASDEAMDFADRSMEAVCYYAYWASTELAEERGRYSSYKGSLWDRGILPQDSLKLLRDERGGYVELDESVAMDWDALRARIKQHGMRNSNCIAIAPTATISNIIGVGASIEPEYQNIYVKSNLSGEFTVVNEHLVAELKRLDLWDDVMVSDLKYFDGSLAKIDRVPAGSAPALRDGVRSRRDVDRRGRRAAPEMDRPGAVAEHLHGGRLGQEARRDVQAGVDARIEDDVLPAHAGGDVGREIDRPGRRAQCGAGVGRCGRPRGGEGAPRERRRTRCRSPIRRSSARSTTRIASPASDRKAPGRALNQAEVIGSMSGSPAIDAGWNLRIPPRQWLKTSGTEKDVSARTQTGGCESRRASSKTAERWPDGCGPSVGACETSRTRRLSCRSGSVRDHPHGVRRNTAQ